MTTIAAKFSTLEIAADTMVSDDSCFYRASKLRFGKDCIYGGCGDWDKVLKAFAAIDANSPDWDSDLDIQILELRKDGLFIYEGISIPTKIDNDVWAIGTGAQWFLGAYYACGDFMKAMQIACENDTSSRAPIEHHKLGASNARKKNK
jgi:hypothetical protein